MLNAWPRTILRGYCLRALDMCIPITYRSIRLCPMKSLTNKADCLDDTELWPH